MSESRPVFPLAYRVSYQRKRVHPYSRDGQRYGPSGRIKRDALMETVDYRTEDPVLPGFVMTLPAIGEVDESIDNLDAAMHLAVPRRLVKRPSLRAIVVELALRLVVRRRRVQSVNKAAPGEKTDFARVIV